MHALGETQCHMDVFGMDAAGTHAHSPCVTRCDLIYIYIYIYLLKGEKSHKHREAHCPLSEVFKHTEPQAHSARHELGQSIPGPCHLTGAFSIRPKAGSELRESKTRGHMLKPGHGASEGSLFGPTIIAAVCFKLGCKLWERL